MLKNVTYHLKIFFFNLTVEFRHWLWRTKGGSVHVIRVFGSFSFTFKHFGVITEILFAREPLVGRNNGFEPLTLAKYVETLKKGDVVLDIGANVGLFSLLGAQLVGEKGRIIAFEPSTDTFNALNENLKLNGAQNVQTEQLALGDTEGSIFLGNANNDALNFIDKNNTSGERVRMMTLDAFLEEKGIAHVDFIKIDIEGAELLCFKGAVKLLENQKPKIIMECNEKWCKRFGYSVFDLLSFLSQFGYQFEQYDEAQWFCYPK